MKRILIAVVLGGAVFAAVFAAAATLGLTSDQLGAGDRVVSSCDSDGINVTYQTEYQSSLATYRIETMTLENLDETACAGQTITAVLTGNSSNNSIYDHDYVCCTTGSGLNGILQVSGNADIDPRLVYGVHIVITGTSNTPADNVPQP